MPGMTVSLLKIPGTAAATWGPLWLQERSRTWRTELVLGREKQPTLPISYPESREPKTSKHAKPAKSPQTLQSPKTGTSREDLDGPAVRCPGHGASKLHLLNRGCSAGSELLEAWPLACGGLRVFGLNIQTQTEKGGDTERDRETDGQCHFGADRRSHTVQQSGWQTTPGKHGRDGLVGGVLGGVEYAFGCLTMGRSSSCAEDLQSPACILTLTLRPSGRAQCAGGALARPRALQKTDGRTNRNGHREEREKNTVRTFNEEAERAGRGGFSRSRVQALLGRLPEHHLSNPGSL